MEKSYSQAAGIFEVERRQQGRKHDPGRRSPGFELVQDVVIQVGLAIAVEQPEVRQQAAVQKLLLGNDVECPAVLNGELLAYGQLALDLRRRESVRGFYLHEPFAMVRHLDQEVRYNVAALAAATALRARCWRTIEQFDLDVVFQLLPCVPDRQGLLLDVEDLRTGYESDGCCPFELALAADRSALLRAGYEEEGAGRAAPQAERGYVGRPVGIGHREGS